MWLFKLLGSWHVRVYRLTGGRVGGRVPDGKVLLLITIGRKSGKTRVNPLVYLRDGDAYVIAGGSAGSPNHPGWYWNTLHGNHPVQIQVKGAIMMVNPVEAQGDQRERLKARFFEHSPRFVDYHRQASKTRTVPIVMLTPIS